MSRFAGSFLTCLFTGMVLVAAAPRAGAAPVLSIKPAVTSVTAGDVFVLDVFLTGADDVFAFDVEVFFDPAIIKALLILPGSFLGTTPGADVDDFSGFIGDGEASGAQSRLVLPGVDGDGLLFSLRFKAVGPGSTEVGFDISCDALDPFCTELRDSTDASLEYATSSGIVHVGGTVAEPVPLVLIGLAFLAVARRLRAR